MEKDEEKEKEKENEEEERECETPCAILGFIELVCGIYKVQYISHNFHGVCIHIKKAEVEINRG